MIPEELKTIPAVAALMTASQGRRSRGKSDRGELTLEIVPERIVEVCRFLKEDQKFARVSTVTAVDWYPEEPRFEVVYHLHSPERRERLRLKCRLARRRPGDRFGNRRYGAAPTGTSARHSTYSASASAIIPN